MNSPQNHKISVTEEGLRLDKFLTEKFSELSRSKIQKIIDEGLVKVNGKTKKSSYSIELNDEIEFLLADFSPKEISTEPQDIPLEILYEDDQILVINKNEGISVHAGAGNFDKTLVNAILFHCKESFKFEQNFRPGIVQRLDKNTTGAMVIAKNDFSQNNLSQQFAQRKIYKEYFAICFGHFSEKEISIETKISRHSKDRTKMAVNQNGRLASTKITVLQKFPLFSSLKITIQTGRTHQIRVHLAHLKHPILGDETYGGRNPKFGGLEGVKVQFTNKLLKFMPYQALHSKTLGFFHPTTKQWVEFEAPFKKNMVETLDFLQKASENPTYDETVF
ncbi:RluA family pseudouridine synthase [bacterium]|nr:RluA family pseudouridine synthase [bacterium]